jgi:dipeptidyl aminopeptidase/acylaminoacyl peptidase
MTKLKFMGAVTALAFAFCGLSAPMAHAQTSKDISSAELGGAQKLWRPSTPALPYKKAIEDWPLRGVTISPDGKQIAGIAAGAPGRPPVIKVWKTEDMSKTPVVIGSARMRFTNVIFIKNDRLMIFANQPVAAGAGSNWFSKVLFTDLEGKEFIEPLRAAFSVVQTAQAGFFHRLPNDPDHILMSYGEVFEGRDIFKVNVRTGTGSRVTRIPEDEDLSSLGVTATGQMRVKETILAKDGDYIASTFVRQTPTAPWVEMMPLRSTTSSRENISLLRMSQDGSKIWFLSDRGSNFMKAYELNTTTQAVSEPIFQNTEFDAVGITFWVNSESEDDDIDLPIAGFCSNGPSVECIYSDPTMRRIHDTLQAQFPGATVELSRVLKGGKIVLTRVTGANFPDTWYLFKDGRQLTKIGSVLEGFDRQNLAPAQWVTYKARDGLDIPAIVFLPPGYDAARDGKIPLVVMPHGGPWWRDEMDYDTSHWPQLFATRGFAVILPQYRGSRFIGRKLWMAGNNQWGGKMQDDKDDGARWLVAQGVADPERMMMFGYSYGGFAAASAATRSSVESAGLYQCAISGGPAIDLQRIGTDWGENRWLRLFQGKTVGGVDPFQNLDKVKIPWLIFHGSYDRQADTIHSRTTAARMKQVNPTANFRYVEIPGMAHTLGEMTPEHREQFIPLMLDMLDNNCGNISRTFSEPNLELPRGQRRSASR